MLDDCTTSKSKRSVIIENKQKLIQNINENTIQQTIFFTLNHEKKEKNPITQNFKT